MFIREKNGQLRNLNKLNPNLFYLIFHEFNAGDARDRYSLMNKNIKSWKDWKAIDFKLNEIQSAELSKVSKEKKLEVLYNGSWQPLVNLIAFDYVDRKSEIAKQIPILDQAEFKKIHQENIENENQENEAYLKGIKK